MYTLGRKMGQPRSSTSRGENGLPSNAHGCAISISALDRHPVTSLLWPQSSLFGLTPQYVPSPTVKVSLSLIYLKSSFIAFSRNWPA
jgi:hypothetical protein